MPRTDVAPADSAATITSPPAAAPAGLDELLADPPQLHAWESGELTSWRAGDALLRYLDEILSPAAQTLETGAGLSTLLFAMKRCHHTVVVPDRRQGERIVAWCAAHGVPTDRLTFEFGCSEDVLPRLGDAPLDVVLIDGAHGFPLPFLDWFYAGRRLCEGGTVVIDDTQIWTGRILRDVLRDEPQWEIAHERPFEFVAATRTTAGPLGEWGDQPFVLQRSFATTSTSIPRRAVAYGVLAARLGETAAGLVRRREWRVLRRRMQELRGS